MAELLGGGAFVHEDDSSALILDHEPVEWSGGRQRGLGWVEGDARQPPARFKDWSEAADAGICGLVLEGRKRFLHSAVNGLAPLYWLEQDGALYFASRIDPLARTSPSRLSIDWDAWASIIALRFPAANATPFAEISRLPQSSTLRRRLGGTRMREERWSWSETEPDQSCETAAEGAAAALEDLLAPLPGGLLCPLSGGRDSRLLLGVLARDGRVEAAVTVPDDEGDTHEEDLAAPVAAAYGVPQERLRGEQADYPAEWEERARAVEYEFVDHAWLVPLRRRLRDSPAPVPDGFAIDVFASGGRGGKGFYRQSEFDANSPPRAQTRVMFDALRQFGHAQIALAEDFQGPLIARAHDLYHPSAQRFAGHPLQVVLAFYVSRSSRGISTYSTKLLGDQSWAIVPGAADPFARASLSTSLDEKADARFYAKLFEILTPEVAGLPSTATTPRKPPHLPQRWCSQPAVEAHSRSLLDGPLAPHLSPQLQAWIADPAETPLDHNLRLGIEGVSLLHSWYRRYRDFLREVDPADLKG